VKAGLPDRVWHDEQAASRCWGISELSRAYPVRERRVKPENRAHAKTELLAKCDSRLSIPEVIGALDCPG